MVLLVYAICSLGLQFVPSILRKLLFCIAIWENEWYNFLSERMNYYSVKMDSQSKKTNCTFDIMIYFCFFVNSHVILGDLYSYCTSSIYLFPIFEKILMFLAIMTISRLTTLCSAKYVTCICIFLHVQSFDFKKSVFDIQFLLVDNLICDGNAQ